MSRSFEMHQVFREAQDRFDHLVLAGLLAVCAFLVQSNNYAPLGMNAETISLISLGTFVLAAFYGFKRIEYMIVAYRLNAQYLEAKEKQDERKAIAINDMLLTTGLRVKRYYALRNILMFLGFGIYVIAKYWVVYSSTPS